MFINITIDRRKYYFLKKRLQNEFFINNNYFNPFIISKIKGNSIGPKGVKLITDAIANNTTLKYLAMDVRIIN
jgi:hypothetical protein